MSYWSNSQVRRWWWPVFPFWTDSGYIRENRLVKTYLWRDCPGDEIDLEGEPGDRWRVTYVLPKRQWIAIAEALFAKRGLNPPWLDVLVELLRVGLPPHQVRRMRYDCALLVLLLLRLLKILSEDSQRVAGPPVLPQPVTPIASCNLVKPPTARGVPALTVAPAPASYPVMPPTIAPVPSLTSSPSVSAPSTGLVSDELLMYRVSSFLSSRQSAAVRTDTPPAAVVCDHRREEHETAKLQAVGASDTHDATAAPAAQPAAPKPALVDDREIGNQPDKAGSPTGFLSASDLCKRFNIPKDRREAFRKALERLRSTLSPSEWREAEYRHPRDSRILYRLTPQIEELARYYQ